MKRIAGVLALILLPTLAVADDKPDWAFPVTPKEQPKPLISGDQVRKVPGSSLSITRAQADDMYNIPNWHPAMYPAMPSIVQHGNKAKAVRACGACHLPTGTGHDESAYVAGLPVSYFIEQMADWKKGNRKYSGTMVALAKVITDEEIKAAADYFASVKPRPWIKVVEAESIPKTYIASGNKRLTLPSGGMEPMGNRIIEIPVDEETVLYRDPSSGFIAYVPKGSIAKGKALAETGGGGKTTPCATCHGIGLKGLSLWPPLAGRHPNYIVRQLWNFQHGDRGGPSAALMKPVVEKLSVDDMLSLAAYAASLTP
jgi:cytochrome c553